MKLLREEFPYALKKKSVHVVLEFADDWAKIHGIYTSRDIAEAKVAKIIRKRGVQDPNTYLAILKKSIEGPHRTALYSY